MHSILVSLTPSPLSIFPSVAFSGRTKDAFGLLLREVDDAQTAIEFVEACTLLKSRVQSADSSVKSLLLLFYLTALILISVTDYDTLCLSLSYPVLSCPLLRPGKATDGKMDRGDGVRETRTECTLG